MNTKHIILLQRNIRVYLFKKSLKELQKLELDKYTNFNHLTLVLRKKNVIDCMKKIINKLNNISFIKLNTTPQVLLISYILVNCNDTVLGKESDRDMIDNELLLQSKILVDILSRDLFTYNDCKSFCKFIYNYSLFFDYWKKVDKNRVIQNSIISYYNRRQHIEYILMKDDCIENREMIKVLEKECSEILKNIHIIDNTYDIENIKTNYINLYNTIKTTMSQVYKDISKSFKLAYADLLKQDLDKNEYNNVFNLLNETNDRLLSITPKKIYNSMKTKLEKYDFINILQLNNWNNVIIQYLNVVIDSIAIFSAPKDNNMIKKWKTDMKHLMAMNYNINLPLILLEANNMMDYIVNNIKNIL